jgi:hypothetical protein
LRFSRLDGDHIVHLLRWQQVSNEEHLGEARKQLKAAGVIPGEKVWLCVVSDGAKWIGQHVQTLFPTARQVLDSYHCAEYLHGVAHAQNSALFQALEWVEATMTRLYVGKIPSVLGGRTYADLLRGSRRSANALSSVSRGVPGSNRLPNASSGGDPLDSGGIESSNTCMCHVRLKRSGAWWYKANSNQMLALRCAKYNGTFDQVFVRHQQRLRKA